MEDEDRSGGNGGWAIGSDRLIRRRHRVCVCSLMCEYVWLLHVWDHADGPMAWIALESRAELASWLISREQVDRAVV